MVVSGAGTGLSPCSAAERGSLEWTSLLLVLPGQGRTRRRQFLCSASCMFNREFERRVGLLCNLVRFSLILSESWFLTKGKHCCVFFQQLSTCSIISDGLKLMCLSLQDKFCAYPWGFGFCCFFVCFQVSGCWNLARLGMFSFVCCLYANSWWFFSYTFTSKSVDFQYCEEKITQLNGYLIQKGWSEEFSAASPEGFPSLEATALKL